VTAHLTKENGLYPWFLFGILAQQDRWGGGCQDTILQITTNNLRSFEVIISMESVPIFEFYHHYVEFILFDDSVTLSFLFLLCFDDISVLWPQ
jgi:hypothetical protein